jgi:hypothetical protein
MKNHPVAPPVYHPHPVPHVLQTKKTVTQQGSQRQTERKSATTAVQLVGHLARSSGNAQSGATIPVHQLSGKPAPRFAVSSPAGAATVQRVVDASKSDITRSGKYLVEHKDSNVLYSTLDAPPPQPYGLYARGEDFTVKEGYKIPLNSWTPNVRFLDKTEAQAEPVVNKPGTYVYKTKGLFGSESSATYSINGLQTEVWNPRPGLDGPPTVGALGKNDCNIWATTLQNLIADERGVIYEMERGREQQRTVRIQSPTTTQTDLNVNPGDLMQHIYEGSGACRYHAATVVAKDGASLVTLEGHVSKNLSRPQFHIRDGLTGFAAEGITHNKGDQVEVIPVTSLSYEEVQADKETREKRFKGFSNIDEVFWEDYEGTNYSYRGRLLGDIGITPTVEKRRRDELAERLKPQFEELYRRDRELRRTGQTPTLTSFPRIE